MHSRTAVGINAKHVEQLRREKKNPGCAITDEDDEVRAAPIHLAEEYEKRIIDLVNV